MVPLRAVAELFDLDVYYYNQTVYISTPGTYIDDVKIQTVQTKQNVNLGNIISNNTSNVVIGYIYDTIDAATLEITGI